MVGMAIAGGSGASINDGSCMYGPLPNYLVSTGTDIVALSDQAGDFAQSCGRCYEVQCNPSSFTDGYGNHIDRTYGCNQGSVIVTVTDSCPCDYPANAYSNRRWCCGDMYHMDLSQTAFSKLADLGLGVIGIKYRTVDCPGGFVPSPRAASGDFPAGTKK
ncbi:Expansin-A20 [Pleodorina starrii]|uniref:Expansin-A20 n=1 Tax=Pleodorina starrii TaxID=330485 RepID=A0A9W6EW79_9CHLO|nr:Expansin-A20 [Pleodorina starrii]